MRMLALGLATFVALLGTANAEDKPTTDKVTDKDTDKTKPAKPEKLSQADLKVLAHRHHVNLMEIEMGKLAQKKGTADVKKYAVILVDEHKQADKNAMALAKKRGAVIPKEVAETDAEKMAMKDMKDNMAKLKTLKGADFDTAFLSMMISGHESEIAKIDAALAATTDADVKEYLTNTRPVIQKHADSARELQKTLPSS